MENTQEPTTAKPLPSEAQPTAPVDYEIRRSTKTGQFERVPVGAEAGEGSATTRSALPTFSTTGKDGVPRALWMDEDDDLASSQVRVAGVNFAIRELRPAEVNALKTHNTQGLAQHLGVTVDVVLDRDQFMQALRSLPDGAERWMEFRGDTYSNLCREHVKGWDAPRPFSRALVDKLYPSVRAELAQAIIQKSTLGQSNADFLETS